MTRMLQPLTLDAVNAESIAQHLRRGRVSHFSPEVQWTERLAVLGTEMQDIFKAALINHRGPGDDTTVLQKNLLSLAATALMWVEVLDTSRQTTAQSLVGYYKEGSKPSDVPKA